MFPVNYVYVRSGSSNEEKEMAQAQKDAAKEHARITKAKQKEVAKVVCVEHERFDEEAEMALKESGLLNGMQTQSTNVVSGKGDKSKRKGGEGEPGGGGGEFPGGSVLAQMLKEMQGGGRADEEGKDGGSSSSSSSSSVNAGGSVLARMFVELLAVQRQALLRGSIDGSIARKSVKMVKKEEKKRGKKEKKETKEKKEKKMRKKELKSATRLEINVSGLPPPTPPPMSLSEETKLHAFFAASAVGGTVAVEDLGEFLRREKMAGEEEGRTGGTKGGGDGRVDWATVLEGGGGGGTGTGNGAARGAGGFKVEKEREEERGRVVVEGEVKVEEEEEEREREREEREEREREEREREWEREENARERDREKSMDESKASFNDTREDSSAADSLVNFGTLKLDPLLPAPASPPTPKGVGKPGAEGRSKGTPMEYREDWDSSSQESDTL